MRFPSKYLAYTIPASAQIPTNPNALSFLIVIKKRFTSTATAIPIDTHRASGRLNRFQFIYLTKAAKFAIVATEIHPVYRENGSKNPFFSSL